MLSINPGPRGPAEEHLRPTRLLPARVEAAKAGAQLHSTPLIAVDAVVLDLETTGLDPRDARLLQIGAVRLGGGQTAAEFATLVNPGVPIPLSASAIHGITGADIIGSPSPPEALAALTTFLQGRPVIGHAVGYDLAVLRAEAERAGIAPLRPRFLDTRLLAPLVAPDLPEFTIETLSAWLGVEPEARHTAIGDARSTARLFSALLPHLRARGIRTWAEAEAASRRLVEATPSATLAGAVPHQPSQEAEQPLARIDSYAYRHRMGEVMTAPPSFLAERGSLLDAARAMAARKISSLFVADERGIGIVTEGDVLRAVAARGGSALEEPAAEIASRPLQTVRADAFVYRGIGRMTRLGIRHLGVTDEAGELVGAVSARDLLKVAGERNDPARRCHRPGG